MARLDDPLPIAYNYKPVDSKIRLHVRKSQGLKLMLILAIVITISVFGFLYIDRSDLLLPAAHIKNWWQKYFGPRESKGPVIPVIMTEEPDDYYPPLPPEPPKVIDIPSEDLPPPPPPSPKQDHSPPPPPPPEAKHEPKPIMEEIIIPTSYPPMPHHETKADSMTASPNSYISLISGFISPELFGPLLKSFLDGMDGTVMGLFVPILESVLPRNTMGELGSLFDSVANGETSITDAINEVLIPIGESSAHILLTVFPETGYDVIRSCTEIFKSVADWLETSDSSVVGAISSSISKSIGPMLSLSASNEEELSKILTESIAKLLPDSSKLGFHDFMTGRGLPDFAAVESVTVNLITKLVSLVAREKLVDTVASSIGHYFDGGKSGSDSGGSAMAGAAINMLSNWISGGSGSGPLKSNAESPPLGSASETLSSLFNMLTGGGGGGGRPFSAPSTTASKGTGDPGPELEPEPQSEKEPIGESTEAFLEKLRGSGTKPASPSNVAATDGPVRQKKGAKKKVTSAVNARSKTPEEPSKRQRKHVSNRPDHDSEP